MLAQHFKSVLKQVVECLEPLVRRRIRLVRVLDDEHGLAMQTLTRLSHAPLSRASRSGGSGQAAQLPALSEAQASKLKMLSVVTLSSKSKLISYDELMREIEARSPPPDCGA